MKVVVEKILLFSVAFVVAILSSHLEKEMDYLWSIRMTIIPVLMTLFALYATLSINLVKTLDEIAGKSREKAMDVIGAMKIELIIELALLFLTFIFLIMCPFYTAKQSASTWLRCIVDGFIVIDVVNFMIIIIDTFLGYLDIIRMKQ